MQMFEHSTGTRVWMTLDILHKFTHWLAWGLVVWKKCQLLCRQLESGRLQFGRLRLIKNGGPCVAKNCFGSVLANCERPKKRNPHWCDPNWWRMNPSAQKYVSVQMKSCSLWTPRVQHQECNTKSVAPRVGHQGLFVDFVQCKYLIATFNVLFFLWG